MLSVVWEVLVQIRQAVGVLAELVIDHAQLITSCHLPAQVIANNIIIIIIVIITTTITISIARGVSQQAQQPSPTAQPKPFDRQA